MLTGASQTPGVDRPLATAPEIPAVSDVPPTAVPQSPATGPGRGKGRSDAVSRSINRDARARVGAAARPNATAETATRKAIRAATTHMWTTTELNLWDGPGAKARRSGQLEASREVLLTGREMWGRTEVVVSGRSAWVTQGYFSPDEPVATPAVAEASATCPDSSVENGLTPSAVVVFRSVCNSFPQIYDFIGLVNRGEHSTGKALDLMISDTTAGYELADYLRANASTLDLYNVIYRQRIFTQERSSEGWRAMEDRGSPTANHMDHVHVSTY